MVVVVVVVVEEGVGPGSGEFATEDGMVDVVRGTPSVSASVTGAVTGTIVVVGSAVTVICCEAAADAY